MDLSKLIEQIKKNRPNLSDNSIKTYKSILNNVAKKLELKDLEDFEKKQKQIIEHLEGEESAKRKTTLAALVVLCEANNDKCEKYREQMNKEIKKSDDFDETNEMTDKMKNNYIDFSEIEKVYKTLETSVKDLFKKSNLTTKQLQDLQNYIILSLYLLVPPRRLLDYSEMKIKNINKESDNYIEKDNFASLSERPVPSPRWQLVFNKYKTAGSYGEQKVEIPKKLKTILNKWIKINPTDYLLFDKNNNQLSPPQLTARLNKIFDGKNISVNILRHSFITSKVLPQEMKAINELKNIASDMGHSLSTQAVYRKIIRKNDK